MADVFLSYSKSRRDLTEALARDLAAEGYSVWWDTSLLPTDNFRDEIDRQLNQATAVIILWTAESIGSKWVRAEADHADTEHKLINTHSSDLEPHRIPKPFNQIHSVDLDDRPAIFAAVKKLIESRAAKTPASSTEDESPESSFRNRDVIILVHGIRDHALWQTEIRATLERHGFIVEATNYGRFGLLRFLSPLPFFRAQAIRQISEQVRIVKQRYPGRQLSIIAHSFGTYVVSKMLQQYFDLRLHRVIFCGSVVPYKFTYEQIQDRFRRPIMNEVGARDPWPAIADSVTWGYGNAGTYGFRRPLVRDRWHEGAGHGYFLTSGFCDKFWTPFLRDGIVIEGSAKPEMPPFWLRALTAIKLKYIASAALTVVLYLYGGVTVGLLDQFRSDIIPQRSTTDAHVVDMQQQIHKEFAKQKGNLDLSRPADFSGVQGMLTALETIDPKNGTVPYYRDELLRIQTPALFTTERCPKWPLPTGVTDLSAYEHQFNIYLERAPPPRAINEHDSDKCYDEPGGYCAQRTEWVQHLLANDLYEEALVLPTAEKIDKFNRARDNANVAMLYKDKSDHNGFTQCIGTQTLLGDVTNALAALAHPSVQATKE